MNAGLDTPRQAKNGGSGSSAAGPANLAMNSSMEKNRGAMTARHTADTLQAPAFSQAGQASPSHPINSAANARFQLQPSGRSSNQLDSSERAAASANEVAVEHSLPCQPPPQQMTVDAAERSKVVRVH